jgi:protein RecA
MRRTKKVSEADETLSEQVKNKRKKKRGDDETLHINMDHMVSTGSTLLDLAISGGAKYGGGIPGGIMVEAFGPSGSGKSVICCEIAGSIQRQGGDVTFLDPEARLTLPFAKLIGVDIDNVEYIRPDTVIDAIRPIRKIQPKDKSIITGVVADSLAALSTEEEMMDKDKFGAKRAKDFSTELRKTCRIIGNRNILLFCSNQVRDNMNAGPYSPRDRSTGGRAIEFYSSVRLHFGNPKRLKQTIKIGKKEIEKTYGVQTYVRVEKNSVAEPWNSAPLTIIFDYGVDDIRENLRFVKEITGEKHYTVRETDLGKSLNGAIQAVEEDKMVKKLRKQVIELWAEVNEQFKQVRKPKLRI